MTESLAQTWLPLLRDAPLLTKSKSFTSHFLKNQKGKDWFLGLAYAMYETRDPQQARMLTKAFLFLYDYMPRRPDRRIRSYPRHRCHGPSAQLQGTGRITAQGDKGGRRGLGGSGDLDVTG